MNATDHTGGAKSAAPTNGWPAILSNYLAENSSATPEYLPRRVRKRFHNMDVTLWQGFIHFSGVEGYVDNIRLRFYLNKWRTDSKNKHRQPTTDDIYQIMVDADNEEKKERKKPFHVERMAENIARNGVQEPIIVFHEGNGAAELWDGNRRFFGTYHVMHEETFADARPRVQWLPALIVLPSGDPNYDKLLKHAILTEQNFVEKDHIPWSNYVKAEEVFFSYQKYIAADPQDTVLQRVAKEKVATEYGLKTWKNADRWIHMYELAQEYKAFHEDENQHDPGEVDLGIQDKFEYFDELSKTGPYAAIRKDLDARDKVFNWLWDGKFKNWSQVRELPLVLEDKEAIAVADSQDMKEAITRALLNHPTLLKDKTNPNKRIENFKTWLSSFTANDYHKIGAGGLSDLKRVLKDAITILESFESEAVKK